MTNVFKLVSLISLNIIVGKMLEIEANRLEWNYNVPKSLRYLFIEEANTQCPLCKNQEVRNWSAPYIMAGVSYEDLTKILFDYFNFHTTPELIEWHRKHIRVKYNPNNDIRKQAIKEMEYIESDLPKQIDEKQVMESAIRSLQAKKLKMDAAADGEYDVKEYVMVCQQLNKWVELKLKMNKELPESGNVSLADLIKIGVLADNNAEPKSQNGKIPQRDGSRTSIKYYVWDVISKFRRRPEVYK